MVVMLIGIERFSAATIFVTMQKVDKVAYVSFGERPGFFFYKAWVD